MSRNSHDSACTVADHNIVSDEYGNFLAVYRVHSSKTFKLYACLVLVELSTLEFALLSALVLVSVYSVHILYH